MHTDPISDMLTRIRNAQAVGKLEVVMPYSKLKHAIADLLYQEGWITSVEKNSISKQVKKFTKKNNDFDYLKIGIKYEHDHPKIKLIKRVSKPGRRIYMTKDKLPSVLSGYGIAIISTSKGVMTNLQAKKQGIGGEIICEIY